MKLLSLIVSISLISLMKLTLGCPGFTSSDIGQKPKTLVTSAPNHIKFDTGGYSVVIDGVGIEVRFDCWAPYPIDIHFDGHLTNRGVTVGLIQRSAEDSENPSTFCFSINVTLTAYEEITGEYTCASVVNDTLRSSHYIYHAAHPPETLLNRNQTLRVLMNKNEEWTILPCASSNPHVTVNLYKEMNNVFVQLQKSEDAVRYDPKIGFSILSVLLDESVINKFRCGTEWNDKEFVKILVLPPKRAPVIATPSQPNLIISEGEQLKVTCEASQEIQFQNSNKNISGQSVVNQNFESNTQDFVYTYETQKLRKGDSGIISCYSPKTNKTFVEWSFRTEKKKNNTRRDGPSLNSYECKLTNGNMKIALYECNNWVECSLRKCTNLDRKCESVKCDDAKTSNCVKNGIIQCFNVNGESVQSEIFFAGLQNKRIYTFWENAPVHSILKIRKSKKSTMVKSRKDGKFEIEFVCEGSAFVFAVGFKWFLIGRNTANNIEVPSANIQHKWKHLDSKNVISSVVKMNISHEISQIICKAPIWNTTEWKSDIFNLTHEFWGVSSTKSGVSPLVNNFQFLEISKIAIILLSIFNFYKKFQ